MKTKIYSLICAICVILTLSLALSSCNLRDSSGGGIEGAWINEDGDLIIKYQDGTNQNVGTVVGKDGADGLNGTDGIDGVDGADGTDGANGQDGSHVITTNGSSVPSASAKGLRSAVSIVCNFTMTVQNSGFWPGSGGSKKQEYSSAGSGVIYKLDKSSGEAFIITNYHVVFDASSDAKDGISEDISVYLYGSETKDKAIVAPVNRNIFFIFFIPHFKLILYT